MANHDAELLVEYDFKPRPTLKLAHTKSEARLFKSILLRKMYNKVWHRYTVLPNVEGQKVLFYVVSLISTFLYF